MRNKIRFFKNLIVLLVLGVLGLLVYQKCSDERVDPEFQMSESPLQVESIRKIAELATVSFKDEVVADTVERYKNDTEKVAGNFSKMGSLGGIKDLLSLSNEKRRLTLIIKGEAKIGFELTDKNYRIDQNEDTLWFHFPKAKILSINVNPLETEVFQESGQWSDSGRKALMQKARRSIERDVQNAQLIQKAEAGMGEMLRKILRDDRKVLIYYE